MEVQSRKWIMRCQTCGHEISVWDAGGVRWKAAGNPTRRASCPRCGRVTAHKVVWKDDAAS